MKAREGGGGMMTLMTNEEEEEGTEYGNIYIHPLPGCRSLITCTRRKKVRM